MSARERVDVRAAGGRCPYCKDELESGKPLVGCAACGARHHVSCHQEHGACSACGSVDALYPREAPAHAAQPPEGSRIQVLSEGDATHLEWHQTPLTLPLKLLMLFALLIAFYVVIPMWLIQRYQRRNHPPLRKDAEGRVLRRVTLTPDALTLPTAGHPAHRVPRSEVGKVQVSQAHQQGWVLTIDHGLKRLTLVNQFGLTPPELEWLAERIRAWKAD